MIKTLLIVPHTEKVAQAQYHMIPQLGVGYLAGAAKVAGHECSVVDAKAEHLTLDGVLERARRFRPDIVGVGAMTHEIVRAHDIAAGIKYENPSVVTFVGGCHASALPVRTLVEFSAFDVLVAGEGERVFPKAVNAVINGGLAALGGVKGVSYRLDDNVIDNGCSAPVEDLDALPFPAWECFPQTKVYPILTSRGCPFGCNFCQHVHGRILRYRTPESVVEELKRLVYDFGAKDVRFRDELFTAKKSHVAGICELILREGINRKIHWACTTHCNTVDRETLGLMKKAGCRMVGFGVESGNPEILERMGKQITLDRVRRAVSDAKAVGLKTGAFFIFGHPYETPETVADTINFAAELNTYQVNFGSMVPYPGTEIYEMAMRGEGGYRHLSENWSDYDKYLADPMDMEHLTRRDLEIAQVKAYLYFYIKNLRIVSAFEFFLAHRKPIIKSAFRLIRGLFPDKRVN